MWGQAASERATLRWANGADGWARSVIRTVRARAEGERGAGLADARGRWAALELGCGCGPLLGQEKEKGRTGLGWWGWAAGPRAGLWTGLPQRDEVGRRPGREERGNWTRVGFGLGFQGCLGWFSSLRFWAGLQEFGLGSHV